MSAKYEGMPEVGEWNLDIADLIFEKEPFAKGAFGKVYKADYFGTSVCVKVICKEIPNEREYSKFTQREVAALKSLSHPNLVQFIGANEDTNLIYLVTEFISGGTLRKHLKNFKEEIPWHYRVQIASDVASAMAFLHSRKIMHRDLKSKNLLVSDNWKIKICDFGFARSIKDRKHARHMTLCGTEEYMAPEVIFGMEYDEKAEVYSFGLLICELITRQKVEETVPRTPLTNFGLDVKAFQAIIPPDCPTPFVQLAFLCVSYESKFRPDFKEVSRTLRNMSDNMKDLLKNAPRPSSPRVDSGAKALPPPNPTDSFNHGLRPHPSSPATDSPTAAQRTGMPSNGADSPPVNGAETSKPVGETTSKPRKTPPQPPSRVGRPALSMHPLQHAKPQ